MFQKTKILLNIMLLWTLDVRVHCETEVVQQCDKTFTELKTVITPPQQSVECVYKILKHNSEVCLLNIYFETFNLIYSEDCTEEYFLIDGEKICGTFHGVRQFSFIKPEIQLEFRGSSLDANKFHIKTEQINCSTQVAENSKGDKCWFESRSQITEILSPNHPNDYPPLTDCTYKITKPNDNFDLCKISVTFDHFDVEPSENCTNDYVLLGSRVFCGKQTSQRMFFDSYSEFSIKFISDSSVNRKGFRIFVEQHKCNEETRAKPANTTNQRNFLEYPPSFAPRAFPQCCNRQYNTQHMILTSPGFLEYKKLNTQDCMYTIIPVSPNICRLKFNFKHFWVGEEDVYYGCTNGYLEINQVRFCGCKDGLVYESYVNGPQFDVFYHSEGTGLRGFVIEVHQEDCTLAPGVFYRNNDTVESYEPDVEVFSNNSSRSIGDGRFLIPTETSRCYNWGLPEWVTRIKQFMISKVSYPLCPGSFGGPPETVPNWGVNYPSNFPPFDTNNFPLTNTFSPGGVPSSGAVYPPTHNKPHFSTPSFDNQFTNKFPTFVNQQPPFMLNKWSPVSPYDQAGCQFLSEFQGVIWSVGYPRYYPPNLRQCFRFLQLPNSCQVQITILDFDLEWSFKCLKDYLLMDRRARYCGNSLQATKSYLNFRSDGTAYLDFISDKYKFGRGFKAVYEQVPCLGRYQSRDKINASLTEADGYPDTQLPDNELDLDVSAQRILNK